MEQDKDGEEDGDDVDVGADDGHRTLTAATTVTTRP